LAHANFFFSFPALSTSLPPLELESRGRYSRSGPSPMQPRPMFIPACWPLARELRSQSLGSGSQLVRNLSLLLHSSLSLVDPITFFWLAFQSVMGELRRKPTFLRIRFELLHSYAQLRNISCIHLPSPTFKSSSGPQLDRRGQLCYKSLFFPRGYRVLLARRSKPGACPM